MASHDQKRPFSVVREKDLSAPMRDGVALRADAYRPDADGPFPVLLCRTAGRILLGGGASSRAG